MTALEAIRVALASADDDALADALSLRINGSRWSKIAETATLDGDLIESAIRAAEIDALEWAEYSMRTHNCSPECCGIEAANDIETEIARRKKEAKP